MMSGLRALIPIQTNDIRLGVRKKCGKVRSAPTVHGQVGSVAIVTPTPPCKKMFARDGVVTKLAQQCSVNHAHYHRFVVLFLNAALLK